MSLMKKTRTTSLTLALTMSALLLAGAAMAQTAPPAQAQNPPQTQAPPPAAPAATQKPAPAFPPNAMFAFVSLQYVVSESRYGKAGSEELKKFSETKTAQLAALEKEIESSKTKLSSQRSLMSVEAQKNLETQIVNMQRKLQFEQESAQAEVQRLNADLLDRFQAKVLPIIEAIRKERNLLVVFAQQDDPGGLAVIAFDPGLDLSAEVVKRLDAVK
jgi:Skp family chaperone for outer membrane proteins